MTKQDIIKLADNSEAIRKLNQMERILYGTYYHNEETREKDMEQVNRLAQEIIDLMGNKIA